MATGLPPRIGDFEPLEPLAEGGMARVVVARRQGTEEMVALKLILPELAADDEYTTMFVDEARINARVEHPNVVGVLDVGRDRATEILFMAMELVLGATLSHVIRFHKRGLPWSIAAEAIAQAAAGLHAAHVATDQRGDALEIVHRDVSPQNLLIGLDGVVRVSDFGVARAARRATRTRTGQFKGKLAYCSPEHALGEPLDPRADIFSLGVVAFEALANCRLFARPTPWQTIEGIVSRPIPSLRDARPDLPAALIGLVDEMLSRPREGRPASAAEVAGRLAELTEAADRARLEEAVVRASPPQVLRLAGRRGHPEQSGTHVTEAVTTVEGPDEEATILDNREPLG